MAIRVVNKRFHKPTPNDYYIGRPSILGNPYSHLPSKFPDTIKMDTREKAISQYKKWLLTQLKYDITFQNEIAKLVELYKGGQDINLLCYCFPAACHGQVIKEIIESL